VVMNAWDVWHPAEFDEDQIRPRAEAPAVRAIYPRGS
jgi:hypothetical protein